MNSPHFYEEVLMSPDVPLLAVVLLFNAIGRYLHQTLEEKKTVSKISLRSC